MLIYDQTFHVHRLVGSNTTEGPPPPELFRFNNLPSTEAIGRPQKLKRKNRSEAQRIQTICKLVDRAFSAGGCTIMKEWIVNLAYLSNPNTVDMDHQFEHDDLVDELIALLWIFIFNTGHSNAFIFINGKSTTIPAGHGIKFRADTHHAGAGFVQPDRVYILTSLAPLAPEAMARLREKVKVLKWTGNPGDWADKVYTTV